jgi:SPP1 family phage portal protein
MEQLEFDSLVGTPEELMKKIQATKASDKVDEYVKQYDPKLHAITDKGKRPDKTVELDDSTRLEYVARLSIPLQKKIVDMAAAILCGNPIKLSSTPADQKQKDLMAILIKTWDDNKLNYDSKKLAKFMMSETEVAELWYTEPIEPGYWKGTVNDNASVKFRLRMKVLANKYGDKLYPVYNNSGDMIAFARQYSLKIGDKTEDHFDVYTDKTTYLMTKAEGPWTIIATANPIQKIPVIYYSQELPEWSDVQPLIERLELLISNHADSNDYFGHPMVFASGDIEGFAKKGEQGKVLIGKNGAKAEYLTWDQAPDSIKLEYGNLRSLIFDMTYTPDITKDNENLSGVQSGIALMMRFLPAHLKAADKEETFGKSIQRRINFLKSALVAINLSLADAVTMNITPKFEYYLPKDNLELVNLLNTATGNKPTLSQATAVKKNPFVDHPDEELELIKGEGTDTEFNA